MILQPLNACWYENPCSYGNTVGPGRIYATKERVSLRYLSYVLRCLVCSAIYWNTPGDITQLVSMVKKDIDAFVHRQAPGFCLPGAGGNEVCLSAFRGK